MAPRDDDDLDTGPEPTARPSERNRRDLVEQDDEKVVPLSNVGGAAPTSLGLDSGGNFPESDDDLANLSEPEPPGAPEVDALHVEEDEEGAARTDDVE